MAITTTITSEGRWPVGNRRIVQGRSVLSGGVATGDVVTGLNKVESFVPVVAAATQQGVAVNETLPLSSGDVTVVVETNDSTFDWTAIGI